MDYKQADILKGYIVQLQAEAFEEGFKIASEQGQIHGHWESSKVSNRVSHCSICRRGYKIKKKEWWNFCPNCGAKMDEEVQDE